MLIYQNNDNNLTYKELFALKGIPNSKSPGNGGFTKEFHETFWDELSDYFINSIKLAYQKKALTNTQNKKEKKLKKKKKKIVIKHC